MRNPLRRKPGIGLSLALAATTLSGTSVMAFPAPADTTTSGAESILPPDPATPLPWLPTPVHGTMIVRSPETGRNVRIPAFDSQPWQLDLNRFQILVSPDNGRNVRVPAF